MDSDDQYILAEDTVWNEKLKKYTVLSFAVDSVLCVLGTVDSKLVRSIQGYSFEETALEENAILVCVCAKHEKAAFATISGKFGLVRFGQRGHGPVEVYDSLGNETITALLFHHEERRLFIGTASGVVFLFDFEDEDNVHISRNLELSSPIVQICNRGSKLAVSSEMRTVICDTDAKTFREVGLKTRKGKFGATLAGENTIFCARPGARIWRANTEGQVQETLQLKEILMTKDKAEGVFLEHSFSTVFYLSSMELLVSYSAEAVYLINPKNLDFIHVMRWKNAPIIDIYSVAKSIWVLSDAKVCKYTVIPDSSSLLEEEEMTRTDLMAAYDDLGDGKPQQATITPDCRKTVGRKTNAEKNDIRAKSVLSKNLFVNPMVNARVAFSTPVTELDNEPSAKEKAEDIFEDYFSDFQDLFGIKEAHYSVAAGFLSKKTKKLFQKTGNTIKQLPGGCLIVDSRQDEELRVLRDLLLDVSEFFLSFDHVDSESNEGLVKAAMRFMEAYKALKSVVATLDDKEQSTFTLMASSREKSVIEDVLQMIVQKKFFKLLPAQPVEPENIKTVVKDPDVSTADLSGDLSTLSLMCGYRDMFNAGKMLDAIHDAHWHSWQFILESEQPAIREIFSKVNLVNRQEEIEGSLYRNVNDRLSALCYAFYFVRSSPWIAMKIVGTNIRCLRFADVFGIYTMLLKVDEEDESTSVNDNFLLSSFSCILSESVEPRENQLETWLSNRPNTLAYLIDLFRDQCNRDSQMNIIEIAPLGFLLTELIPAGPARMEFCKQCQFWPGYVKSLRVLEDKDLLWREIHTIMKLGDVKLVSFLGLMSSFEDCCKMLEIRSGWRDRGNECIIEWDDLGLEILKNLGVEDGKRALMERSRMLPKGSFSARFYREVIQQSFRRQS